MDDERTQLGIRVDADLHRRLKVLAARTGRTMTEIAEEALREKVERMEKESEGNKETPQQVAA